MTRRVVTPCKALTSWTRILDGQAVARSFVRTLGQVHNGQQKAEDLQSDKESDKVTRTHMDEYFVTWWVLTLTMRMV